MSIRIIHIIHGPNLNLLGRRDLPAYNRIPFANYYTFLRHRFSTIDFSYIQSNHEGDLLDRLHEVGYDADTAVILNAAAYTHTSVALGDAVASITVPVVDVHLTDIYAREDYRQVNYIAPHAWMSIAGYGLPGYELACEHLLRSSVLSINKVYTSRTWTWDTS